MKGKEEEERKREGGRRKGRNNSGFHTGFRVGGGKQDGSRVIVACESTLTHA